MPYYTEVCLTFYIFMESLYAIIPISIVFAAIGVGVFFWAVRSGQFEDLEGPAHQILLDEEKHVEEG